MANLFHLHAIKIASKISQFWPCIIIVPYLGFHFAPFRMAIIGTLTISMVVYGRVHLGVKKLYLIQ